MNDFIFQSPTKFVFGKLALERIGEDMKAAGFKRALVVYGGGSVVESGLLDLVKRQLAQAGIEACEFGGVRPNPEVGQVREGVSLARDFKADLVFAVGGGSVIDCAKAIAFSIPYDGDVWDFYSGKAEIGVCLSIAVVLTIPAAGSEASSSCVISNDELGLKKGVNGDAFRPAFAYMDPRLTFTLPAYQTAAGVTDMIAHICERYFSGQPACAVTDSICKGLIRSIIDSARIVMSDPEDYDARANIMWAGTLAHNDLAGCGISANPRSRAGGWESHGMEHEMSALDPRITHGAGLAIIMPAWMRYVYKENPLRFATFGRDVFGVRCALDSGSDVLRAAEETIDKLASFFAEIGMPAKLGDFGLREEDVEPMLTNLEKNRGAVFGGFKKLSMDDARTIYLSAF